MAEVGGAGAPDRGYAEGKVKGPAIALIVVASIHLVIAVIGLLLNIAGAGMVATSEGADPGFMAQASGNILGSIIGICIQGLIMTGAIKMMKLQSFGLAMTASVLSVIPFCSSCVVLGIPFGIWALVVINDQAVKSQFQ